MEKTKKCPYCGEEILAIAKNDSQALDIWKQKLEEKNNN